MTNSTTPTSTVTATELLRQQHAQVKAMFGQLDTATGTARAELFDDLRRSLAVHETAEEICIHPEARAISDAANTIVEARLAEEAEAKTALAELEHIGPDGDGFTVKLAAFKSAAMAHAEAEEQQLFPLLEANLSVDRLRSIADTIKVAEDLAPTHAHPHGPNSGIGNVLVGPFVAMIDKVRDRLHEHRTPEVPRS